MKFIIEYQLEEHGWAKIGFSNEIDSISSQVSYLHDSLLDLSLMALQIKSGCKNAKAIFMDEPGELQLLVSITEDNAAYEARWFDDWQSWGMVQDENYRVLLQGTCPALKIVQQITKILWQIHQNIGPEKYKELWVEHDFPIKQFKEIVNA
jgi:hypothetical protein